MDDEKRFKRLRQLLDSQACEALLIEQPTDLFYLTGLELSAGKLLMSQEAACLIVDGRYFEQSHRQSLYPILLLKESILKEWLTAHQIHRLGFDSSHTTYATFLNLSEMAQTLNGESYALDLVPIRSIVEPLRLIKDRNEIACLRAAAQLGRRGYEYVVSLLSEGITEQELALELEFFWKKLGAGGLAFEPIIAFGENSSMPHYRAGSTVLKPDSSVLIDIGVVLNHYCSDMTRVFFFGTPPAAIQTIYSIVEEAKQRALSLCRPGTLVGELDHAARTFIASKGYGEYFTHSLGHGVGLDVHEPPTIRETGMDCRLPLQAGMVLTIEPGIYLPKVGGVRLEDTILITEQGFQNLTI
jgi:Xaa-Pro aminopeptidase